MQSLQIPVRSYTPCRRLFRRKRWACIFLPGVIPLACIADDSHDPAGWWTVDGHALWPLDAHGRLRLDSRIQRVIVDVGAYDGTQFWQHLGLSPEIMVIAFEPQPQLWKRHPRHERLILVPAAVAPSEIIALGGGRMPFHGNGFESLSSLLPRSSKIDAQVSQAILTGQKVEVQSEAVVTASAAVARNTPGNILDADLTTMWNAGGSPTQWIELEWQQQLPIHRLMACVSQSSEGKTEHVVTGDGAELVSWKLVTTGGQWLTHTMASPARVKRLRITTLASPSWVSWAEVRVFAWTESAWSQEAPSHEMSVPVITLREALALIPPRLNVSMVKVDAQGFDLDVVRSAGAQLRRAERVQVECQALAPGHPDLMYEGQATKRDVLFFMAAAGFELERCWYNVPQLREENCIFARKDKRLDVLDSCFHVAPHLARRVAMENLPQISSLGHNKLPWRAAYINADMVSELLCCAEIEGRILDTCFDEERTYDRCCLRPYLKVIDYLRDWDHFGHTMIWTPNATPYLAWSV